MARSKRVIIVDVDGPLCTMAATIIGQHEGFCGKRNDYFDPTATLLLKYLVEATGAGIALCSVWREDADRWRCRDPHVLAPANERFLSRLEQHWPDCRQHWMGVTPKLSNKPRWYEVWEYIQVHGVDDYVIIDDEYYSGAPPQILKALVKVDAFHGLDFEGMRRALAILGGKLPDIELTSGD